MKLSFTPAKQQGFSLVETAIVLVILGLLIGGVLRGRELINSARTRNIIDQQRAIQVAFYGFQDRYSSLPGDLTTGQAKLINASTSAACVTASDDVGDGWVGLENSPVFFNNLAQAGFLTCVQCMATACTNAVNYTMTNQFGHYLWFTYPKPSTMPPNNGAGSYFLSTQATEGSKPILSTGSFVDSLMLAEMDRKIDDGGPASGQLRYGDFYTAGDSPSGASIASCVVSGASAAAYSWQVNPPGKCQGVSLF